MRLTVNVFDVGSSPEGTKILNFKHNYAFLLKCGTKHKRIESWSSINIDDCNTHGNQTRRGSTTCNQFAPLD